MRDFLNGFVFALFGAFLGGFISQTIAIEGATFYGPIVGLLAGFGVAFKMSQKKQGA